jgi:segregation and condensation protein A
MLLPLKKDDSTEEEDPRDELVNRLIEYKKFKQAALIFKEQEEKWARTVYRPAEKIGGKTVFDELDLDPETLANIMRTILMKIRDKMNNLTGKMRYITRTEKITIRSKITEIMNELKNRSSLMFSELFPKGKAANLDIVTGFMAALELSKHNRVKLKQKKPFSDIRIERKDNEGK